MPREVPPSAYFFLYGLEAGASAAANDEASLSARTITVHGVGDKNAGAHDAEECSNCFEHNNDPNAQRPDLTARGPAQSKGFRWGSNFCRGNDDFVQQAMRLAGRIAHQQKRQNPDLSMSSILLAMSKAARRLMPGGPRSLY
jgi:cytochrome c2